MRVGSADAAARPPPESLTVRWYRAVALDLDGTLTSAGWPSNDVLTAIQDARGEGMSVLLVTGRILSELELDFPGLADRFDLVVAENGCVLRTATMTRRLAEPVDEGLLDRLRRAGASVRRGQVLLATDASVAHTALDAIDALELDVQLVHNRSALMLLPAGVTKGTGLREALRELSISPHNAIAVGDAENDHALLASAGLGVAVANAVDALRHRADLVLAEPDGAGVAALLRSALLRGEQRAPERRHHLVLGRGEDGRPVTMPSVQTNLLIAGQSESGKSYLGGLFVEQLLAAGYVTLVLDAEGDHVSLGALHDVTVLSGGRLPDPSDVPTLCVQPLTSVVVDLSRLDENERADYVARLWQPLFQARAESALPHWIVFEEAQDIGPCRRPGEGDPLLTDWGFCLISYQPDQLDARVRRRMEWQVSLAPGADRQALLVPPVGDPRCFTVGTRTTRHVRHWHKYIARQLPLPARFRFHDGHDGQTACAVGNLREFVAALGSLPDSTIAYHAERGDFSRWLADVFRDHILAALVATAEHDLSVHGDIRRTRRLLVDLVSMRYDTPAEPRGTPEPDPDDHADRGAGSGSSWVAAPAPPITGAGARRS